MGENRESSYSGRSRSPRRETSRDGAPAFHFTSDRIRRRDNHRSRSRSPRIRPGDPTRLPARDNTRPNIHRSEYSTESRSSKYQGSSPTPRPVVRQAGANTSLGGSPRHDQRPFPKKDMAPVPEGSLTPTSNTSSDRDAKVMSLIPLLEQIYKDGVKSARLEMRKTAVIERYNKTERDLKKAKSNFEKFPDLKTRHDGNLVLAKQELKAINDEVAGQDAVVKERLAEFAPRLVPSIIGASQGPSVSQNQLDHLEKTCKQLQQQLQEQQKYFEEQKKARERMDRTHSALEYRVSQLQQNNDLLVADIKEVRKTAASLPKDVERRFDQLDKVSERVDTFNELKLSVAKVKEDQGKIHTRIDGCMKSLGECKQQVESLTTANGYQQKLLALDVFVRGADKSGNGGLTGTVSELRNEMKKLKESSSSPGGSSPAGFTTTGDTAVKSFESRLKTLEEKVKEISISEKNFVTADIQAIIDKLAAMNKEEHLDRLEELEEKQKSATQFFRNIQGPVDKIEGIEQDIKSLKTDIKDRSLLEKAASLETQSKKVSGLSQSIIEVQKEVGLLRNMSIESKLSAIQDRVAVIERQPRIAPDGSTIGEALGSTSTPDLEVRLGEHKEEILEVTAQMQSESDKYIGEEFHKVKTAVAGLQARCTSLETGLSDVKSGTDASANAGQSIPGHLTATIEDLQRLYESQQSGISTLEKALEEITQKTTAISSKWESDLEDVKRSIPAVAGREAINQLRAQPELLPLERIAANIFNTVNVQMTAELNEKMQAFANSAGEINSKLNEDIETTSIAVLSLDKRIQNINTKDMSLWILSQMDSAYPNLREFQNTASRIEVVVRENKAEIDRLILEINDLKTRPASNIDADSLNGLKTEVGQGLSKLESIVAIVKDELTTLTEKHDSDNGDIATRFAVYTLDLEEIRSDLKSIKAALQSASPTAPNALIAVPRAVPNRPSPARSMSNGRPIAESHQRSTSILSDNGNKKRKLNGSGSGLGINGLNGGETSRKKKRALEDDGSDDSDLELPQPRIIHRSDEE